MKKIEDYLQSKTREIDSENQRETDEKNFAPCAVCGNSEFIQLYRNTVGKVEGSMTGYFSLFGGSVSGRITGETSTLPVLSCKKCHNERLIATWNWTHNKDMFWSDMHNFYFGVNDNEPKRTRNILPIYLENPIDTREYALDNKNYDYDFYNEITYWSTETWAEAGFKISPMKFQKKFLFFKWEETRYPTWAELKKK